jgi:hypothetical protein
MASSPTGHGRDRGEERPLWGIFAHAMRCRPSAAGASNAARGRVLARGDRDRPRRDAGCAPQRTFTGIGSADQQNPHNPTDLVDPGVPYPRLLIAMARQISDPPTAFSKSFRFILPRPLVMLRSPRSGRLEARRGNAALDRKRQWAPTFRSFAPLTVVTMSGRL